MQPGLYKVIAADDGTDVNRFLHDITGLAQHENNSGDWHWMAKDGLGTVRGVYDDTLTEVYAADRDPYGDLITVTGSNPTPFEYTGEPEDPNGLLHLRARYYDPNLAVFNSRDPLETANRYAYVGGDPINNPDPLRDRRPPSRRSQFRPEFRSVRPECDPIDSCEDSFSPL
jgi:RHS repeat-associated protein